MADFHYYTLLRLTEANARRMAARMLLGPAPGANAHWVWAAGYNTVFQTANRARVANANARGINVIEFDDLVRALRHLGGTDIVVAMGHQNGSSNPNEIHAIATFGYWDIWEQREADGEENNTNAAEVLRMSRRPKTRQDLAALYNPLERADDGRRTLEAMRNMLRTRQQDLSTFLMTQETGPYDAIRNMWNLSQSDAHQAENLMWMGYVAKRMDEPALGPEYRMTDHLDNMIRMAVDWFAQRPGNQRRHIDYVGSDVINTASMKLLTRLGFGHVPMFSDDDETHYYVKGQGNDWDNAANYVYIYMFREAVSPTHAQAGGPHLRHQSVEHQRNRRVLRDWRNAMPGRHNVQAITDAFADMKVAVSNADIQAMSTGDLKTRCNKKYLTPWTRYADPNTGRIRKVRYYYTEGICRQTQPDGRPSDATRNIVIPYRDYHFLYRGLYGSRVRPDFDSVEQYEALVERLLERIHTNKIDVFGGGGDHDAPRRHPRTSYVGNVSMVTDMSWLLSPLIHVISGRYQNTVAGRASTPGLRYARRHVTNNHWDFMVNQIENVFDDANNNNLFIDEVPFDNDHDDMVDNFLTGFQDRVFSKLPQAVRKVSTDYAAAIANPDNNGDPQSALNNLPAYAANSDERAVLNELI